MKIALRTPAALRRELAELQQQVEVLTLYRDHLLRKIEIAQRTASSPLDQGLNDSVYVLDDNDDDARAFDEFYRAYDVGHAKTRKFLLG